MFVYGVGLGALQTTNATPNTENDCFFIAAGAAGRATSLQQLTIHGKGAALTSISGITFRLKKWFTTASSGGTGITPAPRDGTVQASKATAGAAVAAVTSGTGGPTFMGLTIGCGAAGPGGWVAPNPDSMPIVEAGSADSLDIFVSSGTASLNFELGAEIVE